MGGAARGARGRVAGLTVWPVKSMGGGRDVGSVAARPAGLAGDREYALVDRRPLRDGRVLSARSSPGLLRWTASRPDGAPPVLTGPDGRRWEWADPALDGVLSEDLGLAVGRAGPGGYADLADSVLITTTATHAEVERRFGRPLDPRRWRTNLMLDLDAPPFAEAGWEGRTITVGDVALRLLHPCRRCTIPTWAPDGSARSAHLLPWLTEHAGSVFGINARVERAGQVRADAAVSI